MCFYIFAAAFGMEASGNIPFAPSVVGFFFLSTCSEILMHSDKWDVFKQNGEMPADFQASFRNWLKGHCSEISESKSFSTSSW